MKRLAAAAALALVLAGSATADVFRVVPVKGADVFRVIPATTPGAPGLLPSADTPNAPGEIVFPDSLRSFPLVTEVRTYAQLLDLWQQAGAAYGVPWQVLASINKVESNFGRNMGPSSAGAIGWMQFMPSTWERWGVDADGDGIANPWSPEDAIAAAARYLAASGGQGDISRAVFSYNHAQWYVDEVLQLAQLFSGGVDVTFNLDRLQISLDNARSVVVQANRKLVKAVRLEHELSRHERAIQRRAAATRLLSDRLAIDRRAVQAGVVRAAVQARVADLRATLARAEADLASARDHSLSSSFSPAAGSLFGAPSFDSGYVFPVGGGPSLVSVSHHHHDYPAADIAAPEGSPVYALSDAVVERAWQFPNGRCGIGLTLTTLADGQSWTYCHLSYLDPVVTASVQLAAGTQIGLVGSTGHATGPHLHLQLNPATSYPQLQPWFERFAGTAFRWQDGGANDAGSGGTPVFAVVPPQTAQTGGSVVLFTR